MQDWLACKIQILNSVQYTGLVSVQTANTTIVFHIIIINKINKTTQLTR